MVLELRDGWSFAYVENSCCRNDSQLDTGVISGAGKLAYAWDRGFDDSEWKKIRIPHDWAASLPFDKNYSSGTAYLAGGVAWYRCRFFIPETEEKLNIRLDFDGVYKNCQVWCNSYYLGRHANGYTPFSYDLNGRVHFGDEPNVIAVKVSHPDIADSRWYTGSGITKGVRLVISNSLYIERFGIHCQTTLDDAHDKAEIALELRTAGHPEQKSSYSIKNILVDTSGKALLEFPEIKLSSDSTDHKHHCKVVLKNPQLWSPDNPYLYYIKTELHCDNSASETHNTSLGIRSFHFDPDKGFFLNNNAIKLKGVCLHDDAGCLGTAVPETVWKYRLTLLKKAGVNAIRMSHNPHSRELYDLCDSMGFLVIDELYDEWENAKNKWSRGHNVYPPKHQGYWEEFPMNYKNDVEVFIKQNRNRPSIIMWSTGNEIDYPNDPYCHPLFKSMTGNNDAAKPAAERMYNPNRPDAKRLPIIAKQLYDEVKKYDTKRPVTIAAAFPELSSQLGFFDAADVIGYNYKEHLYVEDHARFPDKAILGSENSHSYTAWKAVVDNEFISGQFLWTGIDYLGEAKGWPIHASPAGLLDLAGFPKAEYWFRKSLWNTEPFIKVYSAQASESNMDDSTKLKHNNEFSECWNYTKDSKVELRIFTTFDSVDIFINGKRKTSGQKNPDLGYVRIFIPFEEGCLSVCAQEDSSRTCQTELYSAGKAAVLSCSKLFDGNDDIELLKIMVLDSQSRPVVHEPVPVHIRIEGDAVLLGIENGNIADVTPYNEAYRNTHHGRLILYVQKRGNYSVRMESEGLNSTCIQVL